MDELQQMIGDEEYRRITEKLNGRGLLIDDGRLIPKHRFDCVNLSLREHKALVHTLQKEIEDLRSATAESERLLARAVSAEEELMISKTVCTFRARSVAAVRALISTDGLHGMALTAAVKKQINKLRRTHGYLFYDCTAYKLVPCTPACEEQSL